MIDGLKPYPAMKHSGVEWLGDVPDHWEVMPIERIGQLFKGNGGSKEDEVSSGVPCIRYGDLYTRHEFFISSTKSHVSPDCVRAYTPIRYGDVLFAASGETIGDIGRSAVNLIKANACCGGDILLLRPKTAAIPKFLGYAADSAPLRHQKASMGRGFTVVHIYAAQLKRLALPLPPLHEQTVIVRFLNHAEQAIRRYIAAKQKLIKLLNEQKLTIIHQAVTRGLGPNVRLKSSGVEGLGQVPEHWVVRKLGGIAHVFNGTTPSRNQAKYWNCGTVPWLLSGKVNDGLVKEPSELITEVAFRESSLSMVQKGSVILGLVGQGRTRGMCALLGIEACINQNLAAIVPKEEIDGMFLYFLLSGFYRNIREAGRGGNQAALNCEIVAMMRFAFPPLSEQRYIARHLDRELGTVLQAQERAQSEISLIREFRTRLIADVVTGKLDVREAAARLPAEADELGALDEPEGITEGEDLAEDELDQEALTEAA